MESHPTPLVSQLATPALLVALLVALVGGRRLRGTTLLAAWGWSLAALTGLLLVQIEYLTPTDPRQFVPAVLTLCPIIAVLGSKRPQHHAWQFIVASAAVMLVLPAAEGWVFGQGRMPELHVARQGLITALIALGWMNYLATRFSVAVTLYMLGQTLLFASQVSWFAALNFAQARVAGAVTIALAVIVAVILDTTRRPAQQPLDAVWRPFRDQFGAAWSLRVAERFNATARENGWPVEVTWQGMHTVEANSLPVAHEPQASAALDALLRRFVSREWLAARREQHALRDHVDD